MIDYEAHRVPRAHLKRWERLVARITGWTRIAYLTTDQLGVLYWARRWSR